MKGISKAFPGVQALENVSLSVAPGEILALVGENGAGKSTLIKILSGCYAADRGDILLEGTRLGRYTPHQGQTLGLSVIYQEFNLAPPLSVAENIFVGREPKNKTCLLDHPRMQKEAQALLDDLGLPLDSREPVSALSVAEQQMVEIAKAISFKVKLLVMDEPTATLTERETQTLFTLVRRLKGQGVSIIYISHRLEEIFDIADRVTVLRDGLNAGEMPVSEATVAKIVRLMVGRELKDRFQRKTVPPGDKTLEVRGLSCKASGVQRFDCDIYAGEVLGLAGLVGAGRTEIARSLFGLDPADTGDIKILGHSHPIRSPSDAIRAGMGFVTENRKDQGLFLTMAVRENVSSAGLRFLCRWGVIRPALERSLVGSMIDRLRIRTPSQDQEVQFLSGGNQQKVILSRWMALRPRILILDEPTRGIDVGAKTEIYALMSELSHQGVAMLLISSELPEILAMSDRILVVKEGAIVGELSRDEATQEKIMRLATEGKS